MLSPDCDGTCTTVLSSKMGFFFSMQFSLDVYPVGKNSDCFDMLALYCFV